MVVITKLFSRLETVISISTDFELVIPVSPTLTYYRVTINQPVALVDIHLQSVMYCWTVLIYNVRQRHFSVTCLRDLFETVINNRVVIDFD